MDAFKNAVRKAMKDRAMNQVSLAEATGISQSSLSLFLGNGKNARTGISGESVLKLQSYFGGKTIPACREKTPLP